jgi:hypothetical protein
MALIVCRERPAASTHGIRPSSRRRDQPRERPGAAARNAHAARPGQWPAAHRRDDRAHVAKIRCAPVSTHPARCSGTRFWKNGSPSAPST